MNILEKKDSGVLDDTEKLACTFTGSETVQSYTVSSNTSSNCILSCMHI